MMRFTIGLAILAFTAIVAGYQYVDNNQLITQTKRSLFDAQKKQKKYIQIRERAQNIPSMSMLRGDDKKNTIERMLGIGEPNLEFIFIGQARGLGDGTPIVRHTFKIEGPTTFSNLTDVLGKVKTIPGFLTYRVCYGCIKSNRDLGKDQHMVTVEGYLYAYDANLL